MKANFVWDLPDLKSGEPALRGARPDRQRLAAVGHLDREHQRALPDRLQLPERRRQREPDRLARLRRARPHRRRSRRRLQRRSRYRQFNTAAFQGPLVGSVGLESGNDYLNGCFQSVLDLSIARNIRLRRRRTIQLRVDMFNAPNAAIITGRNTTLNLASPTDPVTITNLPFDANGNLIARGRCRATPGSAWRTPT